MADRLPVPGWGEAGAHRRAAQAPSAGARVGVEGDECNPLPALNALQN
jgi:hypothetical protein